MVLDDSDLVGPLARRITAPLCEQLPRGTVRVGGEVDGAAVAELQMYCAMVVALGDIAAVAKHRENRALLGNHLCGIDVVVIDAAPTDRW